MAQKHTKNRGKRHNNLTSPVRPIKSSLGGNNLKSKTPIFKNFGGGLAKTKK